MPIRRAGSGAVGTLIGATISFHVARIGAERDAINLTRPFFSSIDFTYRELNALQSDIFVVKSVTTLNQTRVRISANST